MSLQAGADPTLRMASISARPALYLCSRHMLQHTRHFAPGAATMAEHRCPVATTSPLDVVPFSSLPSLMRKPVLAACDHRYGLAVASAQAIVADLVAVLRNSGIDVKFVSPGLLLPCCRF